MIMEGHGMNYMKNSDGNGKTFSRKGNAGQIIRCGGLRIGYRKGMRASVLSGPLTCTAGAGELVALMGRNGCGKSTLLRTIAGLQDPLGGEASLMNRSVREYERREFSRLLGFVSTEVVRVQGLRVRDLVAMGRYPHTGWFGRLTARDHEMTMQAMEITSISTLSERNLDELSDGERQRAMIARTLAQDTPVLILDEPTAFLDLTHRFEIISLLGDLARRHGKAIVFSSHDLQLCLQEAGKIWLMDGQGMTEGAPEDLVLGGQLEKVLLQDSEEGFRIDPQTGNPTVGRSLEKAVSLSASSEELGLWTGRSILRNGIRVEENKRLPVHVITDESGKHPKWIVEKSGEKVELNSIYELSLYLRTIV